MTESVKRTTHFLSITLLVAFMATGSLFCSSSTNPQPAEQPVIKILSPTAGQVYKTSDQVSIISECDYSKFTSGITIEFSVDTGKTWTILRSLVRKEGVEKDTFQWTPNIAYTDSLFTGKGALLKIRDYGKVFITKSDMFFFTL